MVPAGYPIAVAVGKVIVTAAAEVDVSVPVANCVVVIVDVVFIAVGDVL